MRTFSKRAAFVVDRRPRLVVAIAAALTLVLGIGLTGLAFDTSQDGLINPGSTVAEQNRLYQDQFGGESMVVLWTGDIRLLLEPERLRIVEELEADLRATEQFPAVLGPFSALQFADAQIKTVATDMILGAIDRERAAGRPGVADQLFTDASAEIARMDAIPEPARTLDNADWATFLLFDAKGEIRPILRDNFPDTDLAMMIVRQPGNADIGELGPGSDTVKRLVAEHEVPGFESLATGVPTLLDDINDYLQGGMTTLGAMAFAVMLAILFVVFRVRWRLLPLAIVLVGTLWAFGILGFLGIPLTMVTISGLPIFLGLGVDFAIQIHNRFEEEQCTGSGPIV